MQTQDAGIGKENLNILRKTNIYDSGIHKTSWQIKKFADNVFNNKVKPLWARAAEALILAQYYLKAGNPLWLNYKTLADKLNVEGESLAYDGSVVDGNLMLNEGLNAIWTLICGGSETSYTNANARLGVGDSSTAEAATQTDLQAVTNKLYKAMDSGYPTFGTSQQAVFKSTFASADANWAWNEFSVDNGATPLKNLNRKVSAQGTKTSGQSWALTLTITLS